MNRLAPDATHLAESGSGHPAEFGKKRPTRDIVNFMNFTSAHTRRIRGGATA